MSAATVATLAEAARAAALAFEASQAGRPVRWAGGSYAIAATSWTPVDEGLSVPPVEPLRTRGEEAALVAQGWRFLPLPTFRRRAGRGLAPALEWEARTWLAVPPDATGERARRFEQKAPALAWARATGADGNKG